MDIGPVWTQGPSVDGVPVYSQLTLAPNYRLAFGDSLGSHNCHIHCRFTLSCVKKNPTKPKPRLGQLQDGTKPNP